MPPRSAVASATLRICRPISATASILMPLRDDATLMDEHMRSVCARASGSASIRARSPLAKPFSTRAEKPPRKSTPASLAASSRALQTRTMPSGPKGAATTAMGLTLMRLFTTGMPYLSPTSSQTETSCEA